MTLSKLRNRILLSLVFGVLVVAGLLVYGDLSGIVHSLATFRWVYLPAILGLTLFNYGLRFVKWEFYLGQIGVKGLHRWDSFLIFFAGLAMTITPGKVGEWLKSYLLKETSGTPIARSAPIVVAERFTDGYAMVLLSAGGLLLFKDGWQFVAVVTLVGLAVAFAFRSRPVAKVVLALADKLPGSHRFHDFLASFYESSRTLFSPKNLLLAVALGFVSWLGEGIAMYFVFRGLGEPGAWLLVVKSVFILSLATLAGAVLLLPGGLGVAEGGIMGLSQVLVGLTKEGAATATLLIRVCTLWFGVALGVVTLLVVTRRLRTASPVKQAATASEQ